MSDEATFEAAEPELTVLGELIRDTLLSRKRWRGIVLLKYRASRPVKKHRRNHSDKYVKILIGRG